ncbi:polyamine acetyltransferase, variant [Xylaria nigripes]|nr:polyamine acetyltransferase, variant [Xylaria nigripes]
MAAATPSKPKGLEEEENNDTVNATTTEVAVDDTEDLPNDLAHIQKTVSGERRCRRGQQVHGIQDLLPFSFSPLIRPLTISDINSCIALENAAFPNPGHRCTPEKFKYRLTASPELCMGLFCTVVPSKAKGWEIETLHTAHAVETGRADGAVSVLLAHVVATRSHGDVVTDDAMDYPRDYKTATTKSSALGHQESGRTLCVHSVAVHPKLQGVGMGKLILKAYMQQVKNSALADRIALICQEYLVNYYKRFGFSHVGPSKAEFGGGDWHDMVFDMACK